VNTASRLSWGLRRYLWFVALAVVALAIAVPAAVDRKPERYDAAAQVGPSEALKLTSLNALPQLGETVFGNGAVAQAVRAAGDVPANDAIVPGYVELGVAQDNIIFTVIGHGDTAQTAADLANIAAVAFTRELNTYAASVGTFALQRPATPPTSPLPKLGKPPAVMAGAGLGLALGVAGIVLWLAWRRPVIDVTTAELTTGSPVLGRPTFCRGRITTGLPQLCRRLLVANVETLLLVGSRSTRHDRSVLARELTRMAANVGADLRIVAEPTEFDLAHGTASTKTALVAHEGIPLVRLRQHAELLLDAGSSGVILARRAGWISTVRAALRERGRSPATPTDSRPSPERTAVSPDELDS
jgi:hypothetical protein